MGNIRNNASVQKVQTCLVSGTNIKTINGNNILGSGDFVITGSNTCCSYMKSSSNNAVSTVGVYASCQTSVLIASSVQLPVSEACLICPTTGYMGFLNHCDVVIKGNNIKCLLVDTPSLNCMMLPGINYNSTICPTMNIYSGAGSIGDSSCPSFTFDHNNGITQVRARCKLFITAPTTVDFAYTNSVYAKGNLFFRVSGTNNSTTVDPTVGQVLAWNGNDWTSCTISAGLVTAGFGDDYNQSVCRTLSCYSGTAITDSTFTNFCNANSKIQTSVSKVGGTCYSPCIYICNSNMTNASSVINLHNINNCGGSSNIHILAQNRSAVDCNYAPSVRISAYSYCCGANAISILESVVDNMCGASATNACSLVCISAKNCGTCARDTCTYIQLDATNICTKTGSMIYGSICGTIRGATLSACNTTLCNNVFLTNIPTTDPLVTDKLWFYNNQLVKTGFVDNKQNTLVSGTNIKTINGNNLLGSGNLIIGATPPGANKNMIYNNNGVYGATTKINVNSEGYLNLADNPNPVAAATDTIDVYNRKLAGRSLLGFVGPSGMSSVTQPAMWRQKFSIWNPPGNATTTPGVVGMLAPTGVGTVSARNVATTDLLARTRRLGYVSSTTAGTLAGHYVNKNQFTIGDSSTGLGGFFYSVRFGISEATLVTGARMFVGLTSSIAAPTNVDPTTLTNAIGIGIDSDNNFNYYSKKISGGTSGSMSMVAALGTLYELTLFSPPSDSVVYLRFENVNTGVTFEVTLSDTDYLPATTTLLSHRAWRTNNAMAAAVSIDIVSIYVETDQ